MTYQELISLPHIATHKVLLGSLLYLTTEKGYVLTDYSKDDEPFFVATQRTFPLMSEYADTIHTVTYSEAEVLRQKTKKV